MSQADLARHSAEAEKRGLRVTPVRADGKAQPYAKGQTYPYSRFPNLYRGAVWLAIVLDGFILIDWDGNKSNVAAVPLHELLSALGDPPPALFQMNEAETSFHFIYRLPPGVDPSSLRQSCDGRWLPGVDIKRGNQLCHVKSIASDGSRKFQFWEAFDV